MSSNPNDYVIQKELGQGGFGVVSLVRNRHNGSDNEPYVVKEVDISKFANKTDIFPRLYEMATKEADIMKSLDSPYIVKVFDSILDGNIFRMSMEYCNSGTLFDAIKKASATFPEAQIRIWLAQLVLALQHLHNKYILHRDIKPGNVFLCNNGQVVKLGDFGISKQLNSSSSVAHTFVGTVSYMPPEMILGEPCYTFKSEVWALGALFYLVVALKLPVTGMFFNNTQPLPDSFSAELRELIECRMLNKDPDQRPTMMEIMAKEFVLKTIADMPRLQSASFSPAPTTITPVTLRNESDNQDKSDVKSNAPSSGTGLKNAETLLQLSTNGDTAGIKEMLATIPLDKLMDVAVWQIVRLQNNGETPLHRAAKGDHIEAISLLWVPEMAEWLDSGNKYAAIHVAACNNSIRVVDFFLAECSSLLELKDGQFGRTPLHLASSKGYVKLVQLLVTKYNANVYAKSDMSDNESLPIHLATREGQLEVVTFFIETFPVLVRAKDGDGKTPRMLAIESEQTARLISLLTKALQARRSLGNAKVPSQPSYHAKLSRNSTVGPAVDVNVMTVPNVHRNFEDLLNMAETGDMAVIREIVALTPHSKLKDPATWQKVNANENWETPLHRAARRDQIEAFKFLWPIMSNLSGVQNRNKQEAIHIAIENNSVRVADFYLIERAYLIERKEGLHGRTPLHIAAGEGHLALVQILVTKFKANIYAQSDSDRDAPVHLAAFFGHLPIVIYFTTDYPALIDVKNEYGQRLIHKAAIGGRIDVAEYILSLRATSIAMGDDSYGYTPLHHASANGHLELVKLFVTKHKADPYATSNQDDGKQLPTHLASYFGHLPIVEYLLGELNLSAVVEDNQGSLPIHKTALAGHIDVVGYFLTKLGFCVNVPTKKLGRTLLHQAAEKGHLELIKALVTIYSADVYAKSDADDGERFPIHLTAYFGHLAIVEYFLGIHPDLLDAKDGEGNEVVHVAALNGQTAVVDYLINCAGVNVDLRSDKSGHTPLHKAVINGHLTLVKTLITKLNANVYAKTSSDDGENAAIHLAALYGHLQAVAYFIHSYPAMINAKDADGNRPIHKAALGGHISVVEYLLAHQASDAELRSDKYGWTPLHYASAGGHLKMVKLLTENYKVNVCAKSNRNDGGGHLSVDLAANRGHQAIVDYFLKTSVGEYYYSDF